MRTPAMALKSSPARWVPPPVPDELKESFPGFCFAYAINSLTVFTGSEALTTSTMGNTAAMPTGTKSLVMS
ncbi:hypothetical protein D3C72_2423640 [compost metagenome]